MIEPIVVGVSAVLEGVEVSDVCEVLDVLELGERLDALEGSGRMGVFGEPGVLDVDEVLSEEISEYMSAERSGVEGRTLEAMGKQRGGGHGDTLVQH